MNETANEPALSPAEGPALSPAEGTSGTPSAGEVPGAEAFAVPPALEGWLWGLDISQWQGPHFPMEAVAAEGGAFVMIRASVADKRDPNWRRNVDTLRATSLVGMAYHYQTAHTGPARQADAFVQALRAADALDWPVMIDVEDEGLSERNLLAWLARFMSLTGKTPMIYTSSWKWRSLIGVNRKWACDFPLHIAFWQFAGTPALPDVWDNWVLWQVTSTWHMEGHDGNLDLNLFNGGLADLVAFARQF
jgi:lysozyme